MNEQFKKYAEMVDKALPALLPDDIVEPLGSAMRYSLLTGGKRLRGVLCLSAAELAGGNTQDALPFACAIEMIHCYSLIHDDMPCMDDDDMRRNKPSNHKVFGEAMALLAGDGLLSRAFEVMLYANCGVGSEARLNAMKEIAKGAGIYGMVGGQGLDITVGSIVDRNTLNSIHTLKTGALIKASLLSGMRLFGAQESQIRAIEYFGENIGLAFQITDDILDKVGNAEKLGKATRKDDEKGKLTFPAVYGIEESRRIAKCCTQNAADSLDVFGEKASFLRELALSLLHREK